MDRIAFVLLMAASPCLAANGWALSTSENATRQVTVTLSLGSSVIERWVLPVAKDAALVPNHVQSKWVKFPPNRPKGIPAKILTDTWLGTVEEEEAWVRFMWWPNGKRNGLQRLKNDYIVVPYRAVETDVLPNGLRIQVSYESAS